MILLNQREKHVLKRRVKSKIQSMSKINKMLKDKFRIDRKTKPTKQMKTEQLTIEDHLQSKNYLRKLMK